MGFIDWKLYKKIVDEIVGEGGVRTLTLIKDGEPLLHPKLDKLIEYAKNNRAARKVEIFTNGYFLNKNNWSKRLIRSGLDLMNVSVDTVNKMTYKKIRGLDIYDQVVKNVKEFMILKRKMKAQHPKVVVRAVGMKINKDELDEVKKMWRGLVDSVGITPFSNYGGGVGNELGPEEGKKEGKAKRYACPVLWFNPVVNWDGEVTTCCVNYMRNELIVGDIKTESLKKIWNGEKMKKIRQAHLRGNLKELPTCAKCSYWQKFVNLGNLAWSN
jgi:radical SAM protein with 4Fe4S-binding SPASM domain